MASPNSVSATDTLIEMIRNIEATLVRMVSPKASTPTKTQVSEVLAAVRALTETVVKKDTELEVLTGIRATITEAVKAAVGDVQEAGRATSTTRSYADKARLKPGLGGKTERILPPKNVVLIYPKNKTETDKLDEFRRKVRTNLQKELPHLKVRNLQRIRDGLLIETATQEHREEVVKAEALKLSEATATIPGRRKPRIAIFGVDSTLEKEHLIEEIRAKNFPAVSAETFAGQFNLAFRIGKRGQKTTNWVAEVSPDFRKEILKSGRLYVEWTSCKLADFISVLRCYKCQLYGHQQRNCTAKEPTCSHCATVGHEHKDCNLPTRPTCAACTKQKRKADHSSRSPECPVYIRAREECIRQTEYGA